jgi:hypothetical protein
VDLHALQRTGDAPAPGGELPDGPAGCLGPSGLETFGGTGILMQINVTLGVFLRF